MGDAERRGEVTDADLAAARAALADALLIGASKSRVAELLREWARLARAQERQLEDRDAGW